MKRLPLAAMTKACPQSHVVLLMLVNEAAATGRTRLFTNREKIGKIVGINRMPTISKALTVLQAKKLITVKHKRRINSDGNYAGGYLDISLDGGTINVLTVKPVSLDGGTKNVPTAKPASLDGRTKNVPSLCKRTVPGTSATASVPVPEQPTATKIRLEPRIFKKVESNPVKVDAVVVS